MKPLLSLCTLLLVGVATAQFFALPESSASQIRIENDDSSAAESARADDFSKSNESNDIEDSEDDGSTSSQTSGFSRFISSVFQLPVTVFRMVNNFIASAPFSKLRDEMKNLNISYPKSR